jgi:protein-disulfide isomerase
MKKRGMRGASAQAWVVATSIAVLGLGGCSGGMPSIHSISSLTEIGGSSTPPEKPKAEPSAAEMAQPGALADMAIGKADAPVTIIQYVSLNCESCTGFQSETFPKLKRAYLDKGKVHLIVREFAADSASAAAAHAVRCAPTKDYFKITEKFIQHQKEWAGSAEIKKDTLYNLVKFSGVKRDKFEACLADQSIDDGLAKGKDRAKSYGVTVSPTFFVNGKKVAGAVSFDEMKGVIEEALASTPQAPAPQPQAQQQPSAAKPKV